MTLMTKSVLVFGLFGLMIANAASATAIETRTVLKEADTSFRLSGRIACSVGGRVAGFNEP